MGCVSENGCLGPKRRQKQIYFEIVEAIHTQARNKGEQTSISSTNYKTLYPQMRQRMIKKGYIHKLLNNLLSHKNKINDSLVLNLQLTSQNVNIQSKYAGLLIANQIITQIYKIKKKSSIVEEQRSSKSGGSTRQLVRQQNQFISIDIRYDLGFFRIILHLLEDQNKIYSDVLQSIKNFCDDRKEKIACKNQVWKILEILQAKLSKNIMVRETTSAYYLLLKLVKEGNLQQSSLQKYLFLFLQLWIKQNQKDAEDSEQLQIRQKYSKIIKLFIEKCMSTWDSNILYRSLFRIYSQNRYRKPSIIQLQQKIIEIIQSSDLNNHILRGLFLYLLQFISTTEKNVQKNSVQSQFKIQRYPKIYEGQSKLRAFQTLRRWSQKKYINLNQSINFSGSSLVTAFIVNMEGQRQFTQNIIHQFYKLTSLFNHNSSLIIVNLILCQINSDKSSDNLRKILINLIRQLIQARKMLQYDFPQEFSYFLPLNVKFNLQTRIQLIQLSGFIIKNLSTKHFLFSQYENNHISMNICEFLYSLYDIYHCQQTNLKNLKKQEQDIILYRYQYSNSIISFLKCFIQKNAYPYLICFLQVINDNLMKRSMSKILTYFELYIIYEGMHQINQKIKMPDRMMSINFKIGPSSRNQQFKSQIESFVDQFIGFNHQKLVSIIENQKKQLLQLRKFTMVKNQHYTSIQKTIRTYFKQSKQNQISLNLQKSDKYNQNSFNRQSQNGSFYGTNRTNHTKTQQDLSFKDIFDRIGQN